MKIDGIIDSDGNINPLLPRGWYNAEVISAGFKESKNPESDYFQKPFLTLTVKATGENEEGEEISVTANLGDFVPVPFKGIDSGMRRKSLAWFQKLQEACGVEVSDEFDTDELLHCEMNVELKIRLDEKYGDSNAIIDVRPV